MEIYHNVYKERCLDTETTLPLKVITQWRLRGMRDAHVSHVTVFQLGHRLLSLWWQSLHLADSPYRISLCRGWYSVFGRSLARFSAWTSKNAQWQTCLSVCLISETVWLTVIKFILANLIFLYLPAQCGSKGNMKYLDTMSFVYVGLLGRYSTLLYRYLV